VPAPGPWREGNHVQPRPMRSAIRSRIGFAGLAPLVLVAAVLVVAAGVGLSSRLSPGGTGGAGATGSKATPGPISSPTATTPADITSSGRTLGAPAAPVTLDIWNDYQCPQCKVFAESVLPELVDHYVRPGKVQIVYHDLLVIDGNVGGTESADAANAARCAADQGKFWTYQDWLWANQGSEGSGAFSLARLVAIGGQSGLDTSAFQPCVEQRKHAGDVTAESASAGQSVNATPTLLVNGVVLNGNDLQTVSAAIDLAVPAAFPSRGDATGASPSTGPRVTTSAGRTFMTYVVRPGDYMGEIASRFAITLAQLEAANPHVNPDRITVGDSLTIPWPDWIPPSPALSR
jgi:protein-disulfide isomerase